MVIITKYANGEEEERLGLFVVVSNRDRTIQFRDDEIVLSRLCRIVLCVGVKGIPME